MDAISFHDVQIVYTTTNYRIRTDTSYQTTDMDQ